jgi:hypothetical protein
MHYFTNLFCHETLHVSDSSSVHLQEFIHCTLNNGICHTEVYLLYTQQWHMSYRQLSSRSICSCSKAVYKFVWHITLLSVQWINSWWWTEELSETCRFSWQNKLVKLVHVVGFIIKSIKVFVFLCIIATSSCCQLSAFTSNATAETLRGTDNNSLD